MRILINASNLRVGGGLQVADSVCRELNTFPEHEFTVVLPEQLKSCYNAIKIYPNVDVRTYNLPLNTKIVLSGRDKFMDSLVKEKNIESVLTIFGPSRWKPGVKHVCGFAMAHLVEKDSPYWRKVSYPSRIKSSLRHYMMGLDFKGKNDAIWTENEYISEKLRSKYYPKKVFTVTNNYNQIFDKEEEWDNSLQLPEFDGLTLLTVSANYPHKNLGISTEALEILKRKYPGVRVRFVMSVTEEEFGGVPSDLRENFIFLGRVTLPQLPGLYKQSDVMFLPTLLECFSASYAEAMRMEKPILATDLGFARGLCGDAAEYYSAVDAESLADSIAKLYNNSSLREDLAAKGKKELQKFDSFKDRAKKLIKIVENN